MKGMGLSGWTCHRGAGGRRWQSVFALLVVCALLAPTVPATARPAPQPEPPIVLTAEQEQTLRQLGWPPPLAVQPPSPRDLVVRRGDAPLSGSLTFLQAFATVATSSGEVQVGRENVSFILPDGKLFPTATPLLPLDQDAVLLDSGELLLGQVNVQGDQVTIAGRTVAQSQVALIRLQDPEDTNPSGALGAPGGPSSAGGPGGVGGPGGFTLPDPADPPDPSNPPGGPDEIPWGQAIWRGPVRFDIVPSSNQDPDGRPELFSGTYYATWSEEPIGSDGLISGVQLHLESIVYQVSWYHPEVGSCKPFSLNKQGLGVAELHPGIPSGGVLLLPFPGLPEDDPNIGKYSINVFAPAMVTAAEIPKTCSTGGPPTTLFDQGNDLPSITVESDQLGLGLDCPSDQLQPSRPPFDTIAGQVTCRAPNEYGHHSVRWSFVRGVRPPDVTIDQDPCGTPTALRNLARDKRQRAADELRAIGARFKEVAAETDRHQATMQALRPAFNLMLVAAAGSDLGRRLLELAISDGMLATSAQAGQITEAQVEFIKSLKQFTASYQAWTELVDDPTGWGQSSLMGQVQEDALGEDTKKLLEGAMQMFTYGQILAEALGSGDGSTTLEYIEDNLSHFGPLIPDYAISKARQYVEASQAWSNGQRELARLSAQGVRLAFEIEESSLQEQVRQNQLDDCTQ